MEARRCSRCGLKVYDPDIRFCEKCGVVLVDEKEYNERAKPSLLRKISLKIAGIPLRKTLLIVPILIIPIIVFIVVKKAAITPDIEIPERGDRRSEAMDVLNEIYAAELEYHEMEGRYSIDPHEIGFKNVPKSRGYEFKIIYADSESFVAMAWGNIDVDDKIDIWEVSDKDIIPVCIYDDFENEGKYIDPLKFEETRVSELKKRGLSNTRFELLNKRLEAYRILNGIYQAELVYFEKEAAYSTSLDELGYKPFSEPKYYQFEIIRADKDGFVARAWGNIDEDVKIDVLEVTEKDSGRISCIYNDVTNSGEEIDPLNSKSIEPSPSELKEFDLLDKQSEAVDILCFIYMKEFLYYEKKAVYSADFDGTGFNSNSELEYYQYKVVNADKDGFVALAWGNIDDDSEIDIWEIANNSKGPVCIYNDIKNEGKEFDPLYKQLESYIILKEICEAEIAYFAMNNSFSSDFNKIGFKLASKPKYYQLKIVEADIYGFVVRVWGNIDDDDKIDIWEINNKDRRPICIYDDIKNKGEEIDPLKPR